MDTNFRMLERMITNDLIKFYDIWGRTCAIEAEKKIKQFAYTEMLKYYSEYTPIMYERTNQMIWKSYKPFLQKTGRFYTGGVFIDPSNTNHYTYPEYITEDGIYELVWEKGKHYIGGSTYTGKKKWVGSGENHLMTIKHKANAVKDIISDIGIKRALNEKYSILSFN